MGTIDEKTKEKPLFNEVYAEKEQLVNSINEQLKQFKEKYPEVDIKSGYPFELKCDFDLKKFSL